ncbi:hypothetical protein G6011_07603 [Alternaria panax]|uniref:TauD/TfdA-like domain-containing protein n=1 Tax=Alternaria panax TaxID=48097 RepID=A0AAD4FH63_9PLEO|nr:hypothetical protein G6011_07603 [Alternaria panax]
MAPIPIDYSTNTGASGVKSLLMKKPLAPSGALNEFEHFDLTPVIGREYPGLNVVDLMESPHANELLRELAYIIAARGVVFLRKQNNLTPELQKRFVQRLGELSGKPTESGVHIHPVLNSKSKVPGISKDDEIMSVNSDVFKELYTNKHADTTRSDKKQSSDLWHSDITWEKVPSDYTALRLTLLPPTGGDTCWASGYEMYDRISEPLQKFFETLNFTFHRAEYNATAKANGAVFYTERRGHPENVGEELRAIHPAVRTHPVTGWKSFYAAGAGVGYYNDVTPEESDMLLSYANKILKDNHDLQVRWHWNNVDDMAIWDNRCTYHNATYDFGGIGDRAGVRAMSVAEKPYLDPVSKSRREAAKEKGVAIGDWVKVA